MIVNQSKNVPKYYTSCHTQTQIGYVSAHLHLTFLMIWLLAYTDVAF